MTTASQHQHIRIKKLGHAADMPLPRYETELSAGMDLAAAIDDDIIIQSMERVLVPTGLCAELPAGYEAQIRPRSGLALKHGVTVMNAPGTIDADYRGEIKVLLVNLSPESCRIERGQRIAQMVIAPVSQMTPVETEALNDTARGAGGFGSTGMRSTAVKEGEALPA